MTLAVLAPFVNDKFWLTMREKIADDLIYQVENIIFPFREFIELKLIATPFTFRRYTSNQQGASFGWASTIDQTKVNVSPRLLQ